MRPTNYVWLLILCTVLSFISALPLKMMTSTMNPNLPLLSILQQAYPTISSYKIHGTITQANAEGFRVEVEHSTIEQNAANNTPSPPRHLFVKRVQASAYAHKPWSDLRRTLLYVRTEARFYTEFIPLLQSTDPQWQIGPRCHLADCNLDGLIDEHELTDAKQQQQQHDTSDSTHPVHPDPSYDGNTITALEGRGGFLILDALKCGDGTDEIVDAPTGGECTNDDYMQTSPLTMDQGVQCLQAVARIHAAGFEDAGILLKASERLCAHGGSYHLQNRNPKELKEMEASWDTFVAGG